MHGDARAHVLADDEAAVEIGVVGGGNFEHRQAWVENAGEECRRGGARLVAPERRGIVIRFAFGQPRKCLRGPHVRVGYGA